MDAILSFLAAGIPVAVTAADPLPVITTTGSGALAAKVQGADTSGTVPAGNPLLMGGREVVTNTVIPIGIETTGDLRAVGNTAAGNTDAGKPLKVGAVYTSTRPTYATGQRTNNESDTRGNLAVSLFSVNSSVALFSSSMSVAAVSETGVGNSATGLFTNSVLRANDGAGSNVGLKGNFAEGLQVKPYALQSAQWQYTANLAAAATTAIKAAAGAGVRNYITGLSWSSVAATVATLVTILDGATIIYQFNVPAAAADGDITFPAPLFSSTNTALNVTLSAAGPIALNAQGYVA